MNSPPGEKLCPCKGFSGLRTDKLSHWHTHMCACTHTELAKASGTFATILLIIIEGELYSLRSLTCFAALKVLLQPAQPWTVFGLRADSQPAGHGSELSDTEHCRTARLYFLASWENGATPASISRGGAGSLRDAGRGGSSQVNFPWVIARSPGCRGCKNMDSGLKSSQVKWDGARRACLQ